MELLGMVAQRLALSDDVVLFNLWIVETRVAAMRTLAAQDTDRDIDG